MASADVPAVLLRITLLFRKKVRQNVYCNNIHALTHALRNSVK